MDFGHSHLLAMTVNYHSPGPTSVRSNYEWLRHKNPKHIEKILNGMMGRQNAKKHGLYSGTPPASTCTYCPNTQSCPYYSRAAACVFMVQRINKMAARAGVAPLEDGRLAHLR